MLKDEVRSMEEALERMTEEYKRLQEIAAKTYKAKRNKIKPEVVGELEAVRLLAELDVEEAETNKAKEEVPVLRKKKSDFSKRLTVKKQELAALELKHQKYYANLQEIEDHGQSYKNRNYGKVCTPGGRCWISRSANRSTHKENQRTD
jgi:chromosome segregation ATPase